MKLQTFYQEPEEQGKMHVSEEQRKAGQETLEKYRESEHKCIPTQGK